MATKSISLGQKIKRYRLMNDIRQEDMAEKMGVSRATLINYEKGHTAINIDVLNRLKDSFPDFDEVDKSSLKPQIIIDNSIDFIVLFSVLRKAKKSIVVITLAFAFFGTASSYLLNPYYSSEISLYPAKNDGMQSLSQFQSLAANLGINSTNADQNFNIPDVVRSRLIAEKAVKEKWEISEGKIIDLVSFWKMNANTSNVFLKKKADSTLAIEESIKKFSTHVNISEDRLSGLIKITTSFQDPILSANVANFIGEQVELYIQKENSAQSTKEKLFISERLAIVKKELEKAEFDLKEFKERNRGYEDSPELFMFFSQLFREVEAKQQVYLTLQQQLELARIEEVKRSPILHILDYAVPSVERAFPKRKIFLIFSAMIGLVFALLRTVFRY